MVLDRSNVHFFESCQKCVLEKPKIPQWWIAPLVAFILPLPFLFLRGKHTSHENLVYTDVYIYRPYRISLSTSKLPECLKRLGKQRFRKELATVIVFYMGFILSIVFFVPVSLIANNLVRTAPDFGKYSALAVPAVLLLFMLDILCVNLVIIKRLSTKQSQLKEILQCLIVGVATLFAILLFSQSLPFIPKMVMHIYKFGSLQNASLVLDEIACSLVQHFTTIHFFSTKW